MTRATARLVHHHDISIILPFGDDEEVVGACVMRLATHLRDQGLSFEIIAVDDDSGDNSAALLTLVKVDHPELSVIRASERGQGHRAGLRRARGRVVWLVEVTGVASGPLHAMDQAYQRVVRGERDLVVVNEQCSVARRIACVTALGDTRPQGWRPGRRFRRDLVHQARRRGLRVDGPALTGPRRWAQHLMTALSLTPF